MANELSAEIAQLAGVLLDRVDHFADAMAQRIRAEVDEYDKQAVPAGELRRSCRSELSNVLRVLSGRAPLDRSVGLDTGRRRAEANVPLPTVLGGYRVGIRFLWETVVTEGVGAGLISAEALVRAASAIWVIQDEITETMISGYRDATTERLLAREHERSALVEALLAGMTIDTADLWAAAGVLHIPRRGPFVVVAAEAPEIGRQALPKAEARLRGSGIHSAWQLRPDVHIGIVHLSTPDRLDIVVRELQQEALGRVGVSPAYDDLHQTGASLRFAEIAMASGRVGEHTVQRFDDNPIAVAAAAAPEIAQRLAAIVFGPFDALPPAEREVALQTLDAWFAHGGSTEQTAQALFCHPNTVRLRLRRISEHTGRSLTDPKDIAELSLALSALRQQQDLADVLALRRS